jgi:VanZ like family
MRRAVLSWLPVCAYTGLIWFLSSRAFDVRLDYFPLRDKGVHFVEYGTLAFLIAHAVRVTWPSARHSFAAAVWLTVGLGLTDELHQSYVPGRMADPLDLLADALGALFAVSLYFALRVRLKRRREQRSGSVPRAGDDNSP